MRVRRVKMAETKSTTNGTSIIDAYRDNDFKFKDMRVRAGEIQELLDLKEAHIRTIFKIYDIVFKNFSKRTMTGVWIRTREFDSTTPIEEIKEYYKKQVVLNEKGLYLGTERADRNSYSVTKENTYNTIDIFKEIKKSLSLLLPHISKVEKKNILVKFLKNIEMLKHTITITKEIKRKNIWVDYKRDDEESEDENENDYDKTNGDKINIKTLTTDGAHQIKWGNGWSLAINTKNQNLDDKMAMEQLYEELVAIYDEYKEKETQSLKDTEFVLEELRKDFVDEIMLENLKPKKEKDD